MLKTDIEQKRPTLMALSFMAALSLTLCAFEWKHSAKTYEVYVPVEDENEQFERDLDIQIVYEILAKAQAQPAPSRQESRSNRFEFTDRIEPMSTRPSSAEPLQPIKRIDKQVRGIKSPIQNGTNTSRKLSGLQPHEMPYVRSCAHIEDDIERFQCTHNALRQVVLDNFRAPSMSSMGEGETKVKVLFTIDSNGAITRVHSEEKVSAAMEREILRVFDKIPNMVPAVVQGRRVDVRFEIPIVIHRKS